MNYAKLVKLSEIAELITKGTTPTTLGYDFQDKGVNFLKVECFDEKGTYLADKVAHISDACNEKLKRSQLKVGDILFSIAGAIGRVGIVTEGMLPANTNQALAIIRIQNKDIYLPYIKLVLTSPVIKKQFEKKKQGVAQLNLSLKDVNELSIPLPNKEKQKVIVDLFNRVNILIKYINNELEYLDKFIKARFVELFGNPIYNTKKLPTTPLNELGDWSSGGTPSRNIKEYFKGEINWYSAGELNTLFLEESAEKITREAIEKSTAKLFEAGSMLIGMYDTAAFKMGILRENSASNQACACITPTNRVNIIWLYYELQLMKDYFLSKRRGVRQKNLNLGMIKGFEIPIVSRVEQDKFATFVKEVNKSKVEVQKALDKAQLLFDSLMQKYFG